jgi:hypothetical protein
MPEKKNILPVIALIAAILALAVAVFSLVSRPEAVDPSERITALEQENAQLRGQIAALKGRLDSLSVGSGLSDWNLVATAWEDGMGADVTMSAAPGAYEEGMEAVFSIRLNGQEVRSIPCDWDGSAFFTATAKLESADGYSYYCILINPDGSQDEIELNSPENVTNDTLVYLGSSLSSYANLVVEDWAVSNSSLTLKSGYVHAQMPQLTFNDAAPEVAKSSLVLKLNNEEVSRKDLTLEPGEGSGSYEATLNGLSFAMPAMQDDYQLDLWLELVLNSGNTVTVSGGSWYSSNGELQLVVG